MHLFERATESGVVYGSKAVGEPPLMEAFSAREAAGGGRVRARGLERGPRLPVHPGSRLLGCPFCQGCRRRPSRRSRLTRGVMMDWLKAAQQLRDEGQPACW